MKFVKVFSKKNCMQCKMVKNWLVNNQIDFEEIKVDECEETPQELVMMGFTSLPVTYIDSDNFNGYVQGFAVNKLNEYLKSK